MARPTFTLEVDAVNLIKQLNKKVEDFSGKGGAMERTINRLVPFLDYEYITVINSFKNPTGETEESLMTKPELKLNKKGQVVIKYGFKISDGGLAALFINYGRPGVKYKNGTVSKPMQPTFFIDNIIKTYNNQFNKIFVEEVKKELGGLL